MYRLMQYKSGEIYGIFRTADHACIPVDPLNADYADYLEWVAEGNIAPPDPNPGPY